MRLATQRDDTPDGRLVVVSRDRKRFTAVPDVARTLQAALDRWESAEPGLVAAAIWLDGVPGSGEPTAGIVLDAPLPRAWQWLDASAYPEHASLMQRAYGLPPLDAQRPLMYQGMSHRFLAAADDAAFPSEADGIDFEGEFGVIVDFVPMGTPPASALAHVKLLVQLNDWSLREIAPVEMRTGFGWVQAKPACTMAPFAITPDELGAGWQSGRIAATLHTWLNGERFGSVEGASEMAFGFHELISHAARTRSLCAGTVIGSGTVSTRDHARAGSSCISERRAIETIAQEAQTPFLCFGDEVRMRAEWSDTADLFGQIDQRVVSG